MDNYECSMCGAQYDNRDALVNHLKEVHPTQRVDEFECSKCGAKFGSMNELAGHVTGSHPVQAVIYQ